jgi:hypothetical protein
MDNMILIGSFVPSRLLPNHNTLGAQYNCLWVRVHTRPRVRAGHPNGNPALAVETLPPTVGRGN